MARDQEEITRRLGGALFAITSIEVTVAAAGPDWPDLAAFDDETLALPNVVSNIEEGVGFLSGIIVGELVFGCLIALIFVHCKISTVADGAKHGAILGFLITLGYGHSTFF